jgi:hypothetical protein
MRIQKSSGDLEKFSGKKIYNSIREVGGSNKLARNAVLEVKKRYYEGMSTDEILFFLLKFLKQEPGISERYDLKRAVMSLGPTGFPFESFFARILEYNGFKTSTGNKLKGKIIFHEVDIIAKKEKKFMIECKYHNERGTITRLHPAMYTYARFLDLKETQDFDQGWLVTNTKCSPDANNYSKGVGLKITSWNYPKNESLLSLIENKKLYPITILKSLPKRILTKLYSLQITVAKDLLNLNVEELKRKTGLSEKDVRKIQEEVKIICG